MKMAKPKSKEWLLFFYSVPSKPVSNRMRIWRMLVKAGAVQFKGSVYILPASDDHYELFQWLVSSVTAMQGEAAFVKVAGIETMKEDEIIGLFDQQREKEYVDLGNRLDEFENRIGRIGKTAATVDNKKIEEELQKLLKEFQDMGRIDFFYSKGRKELEKRLRTIASEIAGRTRTEATKQAVEIIRRRASDYQEKAWVTRKRPFVDRIASAWLIRGFIDQKAAFDFIEESEVEGLNKDAIAFDLVGGEFTHVGDMCTFEVLLKSFGLRDKTLGVVAEIVHQLDLQDDLYRHPAAEGLREILDGIRKTVADDHEALEKGMSIFEMLYASRR
jgi:hypothetical protein